VRPNIERPPWSTEIARLHGGEITATNIAGGGSEFVVSLPASPRT
jgi:signal transduction histidine kinase